MRVIGKGGETMSLTAVKYLAQLKDGDIISNDVFFKRVLLVKAGTIVNRAVIRKLEQWGVTKINVIHPDYKDDPKALENLNSPDEKKTTLLFSKEIFDIKQLFYESLQYVVNESRYGYVLHNDEQMQWLERLFVNAMSNSKIYSGMVTLKKVEPYTYFHSFDVFLLGSVLADAIGVKNIQMFATSCLIHDIGKLKVPKELLEKEGKLSKEEFEEIQNHTIYGAQWIKEKNLPEYYGELAKSHHERLDGSGYPQGLTAEQLSSDVRIMAIIDTYSALTLKRPYREPFSSTKAIELLLSKPTKYDNRYLVNFLELLNIYPAQAIVKLSNGKTARIKSVNDNQPYRPLLEELDGSKTFELPTNLSITIPRFVKWEQVIQWNEGSKTEPKDTVWNNYLTHLVNGNREQSIEVFKKITEGMTVEKIFIDVIVKSIKEIELKWDDGQLSVGEEHDALLTIKDLLDITLNKMEEKKGTR